MPTLMSMPDSWGHPLRVHLGRLSSTLNSLGWRLRESVAEAIGIAVAAAVRQSVTNLLRLSGENPDFEEDDHRYDSRGLSRWQRSELLDDSHEHDESGWDLPSHRQQRQEEYDGPFDGPRTAQPAGSAAGLWRGALSAGCRLLAWWLGRLAAPGAVLVAAGTGLATALAVWLSGKTAGPGSLLALMDALAAALSLGGTARA